MAKLTVKQLEALTESEVGKRLSDEQSLYGVVKGAQTELACCFDGAIALRAHSKILPVALGQEIRLQNT